MRALYAVVALLFALPVAADSLYLAEFTGPPAVSVYYQAAPAPAIRTTVVPITGASVQSLVFTATTKLVRVHCDISCYVAFGANAAATDQSMLLGAGQTEYFTVIPGQRLAVLTAAAP